MSRRSSIMSGAVLALAGALCASCQSTSGSTLSAKSYPSCSTRVPVWLDSVRGSGGQEAHQVLLEELLGSGCFTLASSGEDATVSLSGTSSEQKTSGGGGSGVTVQGVGVNLGRKQSAWRLHLSLREIGAPSGGTPFMASVGDEISSTGVDIGGSYSGEGVSTSTAPDSPDIREARRRMANNLVYELIQHLRREGRL